MSLITFGTLKVTDFEKAHVAMKLEVAASLLRGTWLSSFIAQIYLAHS